jgi:hypothetical protein
MKIYLISGDGYGSGKSTLAAKLGDEVWSIAGALREDLSRQYPGYKWFSKDQAYKETTRIKEYGSGRMSMRDVLVEYGQKKAAINPTVWVSLLSDRLLESVKILTGAKIFVIDDVRKLCEIDHLRSRFSGLVTHFHVVSTTGTPEPHFENDELKARADYHVKWQK